MGLRLLVLGWWTPKYIVRRELENLSDQTIDALKALVSKYAIKEVDVASQTRHSMSVQEQRAAMARVHAKLVEVLEEAMGREKAVELGREALFLVGQNLGRQTRSKLGVGNKPEDLRRAAEILYRVLGIEFRLEWLDSSNAKAVISRCALAEQYSELTCKVLSATDEGVINGLQPNVAMKFKEYMTSGCQNCCADLHFSEREAVA